MIDVSNLLYRNYHALKKTNMRLNVPNYPGMPIWGVHGFMLSLAKLSRFIKPDFLVCALDSETGCPFRRTLVPEYKKNRPPISGDLKTQLIFINELLTLATIPSVVVPLWEADDVIASVACISSGLGYECFIATSDRDALQLISKTVTVVDPSLKLTSLASLQDSRKVTPTGYLYLAALRGEPSDGITGVPFIGEKTALLIAQEIQHLDPLDVSGLQEELNNVLSFSSFLSSKQRDSLRNNLPLFFRNIKVARLNRSLPIADFFTPINKDKIVETCKSLGLMRVSETLNSSLSY